jgi:Fe-S cluster biogenesis protein NfuA
VSYNATVTELAANGTSAPLAGALVGFTTCEGFELTTNASGQAITQLTQGIPVTPIYDSTGAISALGAEIPATGDVTTTPALFADALTTIVPGFAEDGGDAAIIEIVLAVDATATSPCNATSGVTLTVTGHTEATVSYMGASWPSDTSVASTSASTDGDRAFIGGIAGATSVKIAGTKSGCNVVLVTASQTGNFLLLPGSITIGVATITN